MMVESENRLPWLNTKCMPDWEVTSGRCVPLKCANPKDMLDSFGNVIGWPIKDKAGCGEIIEYECAPGMIADMTGFDREKPYSLCDDSSNFPNANQGEMGSQGFFSEIKGKCVRKYN